MPKEEETIDAQRFCRVRYGEIFLKGLNRPTFLRMLVDRVRDAVKAVGAAMYGSVTAASMSAMRLIWMRPSAA